jgi:hypothetical protein
MLAVAAAFALLAAAAAIAAWRAVRDSRRAALLVARSTAGGAAALALVTAAALLAGAAADPCEAESAYHCLRRDDFAFGDVFAARVLVLDHLAHGINLRDRPAALAMPYLHGLDQILAERGLAADATAYLLGGGAYTLPRSWAVTNPARRIVVAELDPAVTRAARDWMWLGDAPALEVRHGDGRVLLARAAASERYDLVFADAFHDLSMPAHLVTREWHEVVRARLAPGGVYAANVMEDRSEPRFLLALVRTLQASFSAVEVWVEATEAPPGQRITYLVLASDTPSFVARVASSTMPPRQWARLPNAFVLERIRRAEVPLLTDDYAPVERLMAHLLLSTDASR